MNRVVAGDVGGTKTLLRCVEPDGSIAIERRFDSSRYATFDAVLRDFLQHCPAPISGACFAVAGPYGGTGVSIVIAASCILESALLFLIAKRRLGLHMLIWRP